MSWELVAQQMCRLVGTWTVTFLSDTGMSYHDDRVGVQCHKEVNEAVMRISTQTLQLTLKLDTE